MGKRLPTENKSGNMRLGEDYHIDIKLLEDSTCGDQAIPYQVIWKTAGGEKFSQVKQVHENWSDDQQIDNYTRLFHKYTSLYDLLSVIRGFN